MIILFFLLLVTSAVGAGAAAGLICSEFGIGLRHGARVFEAWFVISVLCALVLSAHAFKVVFASTKDMFLPS
ncbi:MAG TPA: hypothetical protein VGZ22_16455 [Isosphaeraceae bacterium]|nr:hypothetical protein [Isosphaeraceae bacterium]